MDAVQSRSVPTNVEPTVLNGAAVGVCQRRTKISFVATIEMKWRPSNACRTCHGKRVNGAQCAQIKAIQRGTWRPFGTNLDRIRTNA